MIQEIHGWALILGLSILTLSCVHWWHFIISHHSFKKKHKHTMRPLSRTRWSQRRTGRQGPGISVASSLQSTTPPGTSGRMASFRCWCVLEPGTKKLYYYCCCCCCCYFNEMKKVLHMRLPIPCLIKRSGEHGRSASKQRIKIISVQMWN